MRSKVLEKILKETPLEVRLNTSNEMAFIVILTELGFRDGNMWSEADDELLKKLCEFAKKHTKYQLERIKEWEDDGRPE
jgi:hypothetical protein